MEPTHIRDEPPTAALCGQPNPVGSFSLKHARLIFEGQIAKPETVTICPTCVRVLTEQFELPRL
jgi:hypothetical protein